MKTISIYTPGRVLTEREKLIDEIIELMKRQSRSNERYAVRINFLRNKLTKLERGNEQRD